MNKGINIVLTTLTNSDNICMWKGFLKIIYMLG
jgi:hypothetical protein